MKFPQTFHPNTSLLPSSLPTPPPLSNDVLAVQLQQNWLANNPKMEHLMGTKDSLDDSLTSLNWLQNMNLSLGDESTPPMSPRPSLVTNELMRVNPNQILATNLSRQKEWQGPDVRPDEICLDPSISFDKIDYKNNPYIKPPYRFV